MPIDKKDVQDILDKTMLKKYAAEMTVIFGDMEEDADFGSAIEHIFEESRDLNEFQEKLILLVQKYAQHLPAKIDPHTGEEIGLDDQTITHDIMHFTRTLIKKYENKGVKHNKYLHDHHMDEAARMNIRRILKEFAIYEMYKVMNPKRISGETKKDNYAHNMVLGGEKRASHYEGGKEADLKSYGEGEVHRIKGASQVIHRKAKGFDGGH